MAEGARLESVCTLTCTEGSNPSSSVIKRVEFYSALFFVGKREGFTGFASTSLCEVKPYGAEGWLVRFAHLAPSG